MTTVAVLSEPPRPGRVLSPLVDDTPLTPAEAAELYAAMLRDVADAVERSGGDLLVNYREDDALPDDNRQDDAPPDDNRQDDALPDDNRSTVETEIRDVVRPALEEPDAARFEVQVGETFGARAGNTATHLLEREDVESVALVEPTSVFLGRTEIDGAAMKLRRSEVVLGPARGGRVYYAGFTDTVDFRTAYTPPAVGTLAARARDAGHDVDFLEVLPVVETAGDLASALVHVDARQTAGLPVPDNFVATCEEFDLGVEIDGTDLRVVR